MRGQSIDMYLHDLSDGKAHFCRVAIDVEDMKVMAFDRVNGDMMALGTVVEVAKYAIMADMQGVKRWHVGDIVRRECLKVRGTVPSQQAVKLTCAVCGMPQFMTPSGMTCLNGHGGAPSSPQEKTR